MMPSSTCSVVIFIPSLERGGAERQVVELARALIHRGWRVKIVTMYPTASGAAYDDGDVDLASAIVCLNKRNAVCFFIRFIRVLAVQRTCIVHAYLGTSQLYAIAAKLLLWRLRLVVGVRDALPLFHTRTLRFILCDLVVFRSTVLVGKYIFNSTAGLNTKGSLIASSKKTVIPNFIDVEKFRFRPAAREHTRSMLGISKHDLVAMVVANVTPYKDFVTLVAAAAEVAKQLPNLRFVIVGRNDGEYAELIKKQVASARLDQWFQFIGVQRDVEIFLSAADVYCSSSYTEAFSNSIAEAMACGVPCVVTDVGDSAAIVGDTGIVVPAKNPAAFASGLTQLLVMGEEERRLLGEAARSRVVRNFSSAELVSAYEKIYEAVL